ncbi:MAG: transposase [Deferrisomatales bacterium]|nr:transposase [Deferrisomatales bacterium]
MPNYRRSREGSTYFLTVGTYRRRPILCGEASRAALREAIREARLRHPFVIDAWVLLPDHLHCIWTLPEGDGDYSTRWGLIKAGFTRRVAGALLEGPPASASRREHREKAVWQRRFWEHTIRDDRDHAAHRDYIHYNPVKHGWAAAPRSWPWSTFHRYAAQGVYAPDWGSTDPAPPAVRWPPPTHCPNPAVHKRASANRTHRKP